MQELTLDQFEFVAGGGPGADAIGIGSAIGGGIAISAYGGPGSTMAGWAAAGAVGAFAGAALVGSFVAGYAIGTWIYDNVVSD